MKTINSLVEDVDSLEQDVRREARGTSNLDSEHKIPPAVAPDTLAHVKYRPDIDGLRAVAVISVLIFHAFPRWLAGGYVGVDIFFVISGYLISSILFTGLMEGTFSFGEFYARRARRIFPALITVLLATVLFGWYVLTPDEFSTLGKHVAAGSGFVGNITLWLESGYFDTSSDVKPLLHLWSLGVEEQFYIVWPLLLWGVWRRNWNLLTVGALLFLVSFVANVAFIHDHADAVFYLSVTRFWELLAGAGLAYVSVVKNQALVGFFGEAWTAIVRNAFSFLGLLLLVAAIFTIDKSHAVPGWWALVPVAGAVLVIAAGPQALLNRFLLGNRVAVAIGLISYPVYLWHWPLLAYGRIFYGNDMSKELRFGLLLASLVLASATYFLIEKWLRRPNPRATQQKNRFQLIGLYAVMAICCLSGLSIYAGMPAARSSARDVDALLAAQYDWDFPPRTFAKLSAIGPNFYTRAGTETGYTVFIGDSVVEHYAARVERLLSDKTLRTHSVIFATGPACPSIPGVAYIAGHAHPACPGVLKGAYDIARRPDVKTVVIGGRWDESLDDKNTELMYRSGETSLKYGTPGAIDAAFAALEEQVALLSKTKQVYILLNSPINGKFSPKTMLEGSRWTTLKRRSGATTTDINNFMNQTATIRERLTAMASRHGAKIIDPIATLCQGTICPTVSETGEPYYIDHLHMRPFYVREKATFIDEAILVK
jgi:peptidoglycan/LPS O-acetylase OafA/YrhL